MNQSRTAPANVRDTIDHFVEAFNVNDLDKVVTFFARNAVYRPGDGSEHHGPDEIRRAFAPQFSGAFGTMRFDEHDRLIDEVSRKAAIRWVCRHDLAGTKSSTPLKPCKGSGSVCSLASVLAGKAWTCFISTKPD